MKNSILTAWKENKLLMIVSAAVILMPMAIGLVLWNQLPETIATHFDLSGEPNGFSSKAFTVFGMPLLLLGLHIVCIMTSNTPRLSGNLNSNLKRVMMAIIPACSLLVCTMVYGYALGVKMDMDRLIWIFIGVIFLVMGNYLPKVRPNRTTGIKLPWTLASEENWNVTHRMAGPVWVIAGFVVTICGITGANSNISVAAIAAAVTIPTVFSFGYAVYQANRKE